MPEVELEPLRESHVQGLLRKIRENNEDLSRWLPWLGDLRSVAAVREFVREAMVMEERVTDFFYVVRCRGEICGLVNLGEVDLYDGVATMGYWICSAHTGRGLASRAVSRLMNIAFVEKRLHKLEIRCAEKNIKSRLIPERLGFIHEANLRQSQRLRDAYVNQAIYSMLESEYFREQVAGMAR